MWSLLQHYRPLSISLVMLSCNTNREIAPLTTPATSPCSCKFVTQPLSPPTGAAGQEATRPSSTGTQKNTRDDAGKKVYSLAQYVADLEQKVRALQNQALAEQHKDPIILYKYVIIEREKILTRYQQAPTKQIDTRYPEFVTQDVIDNEAPPSRQLPAQRPLTPSFTLFRMTTGGMHRAASSAPGHKPGGQTVADQQQVNALQKQTVAEQIDTRSFQMTQAMLLLASLLLNLVAISNHVIKAIRRAYKKYRSPRQMPRQYKKSEAQKKKESWLRKQQSQLKSLRKELRSKMRERQKSQEKKRQEKERKKRQEKAQKLREKLKKEKKKLLEKMQEKKKKQRAKAKEKEKKERKKMREKMHKKLQKERAQQASNQKEKTLFPKPPLCATCPRLSPAISLS